jgi:hypothetical protein
MKSFHEDMIEFKKQLDKGHIQVAYKCLIEYFGYLKSYFKNKYPENIISGSTYFGYMDMTYFPISTDKLKQKKLKIAVVFVYDDFRFEVWLSAVNKIVLANYWKIIKDNKWDKYKIVKPGKGIDFILQHIVDNNPDFSDLNALTKNIEKGTMTFISDVENFLSTH